MWWHRVIVLALGAGVLLSAATADDLLTAAVASVPADELGAGSPARANAIAAVVDTPGLSATDHLTLQAALAEAWIDALDAPKAESAAAVVLAASAASPELRERAGLVQIAAWQIRVQAADPQLADPVPPAKAIGERVEARALVARARWRLAQHDVKAAVQDLDAALQLLARRDPAERVPVYALRLTAMEDGGAPAAAVHAWVQEHRADPAAGLAAAAALSAGSGLAGQPAPALHLKRLDGQPGGIDLTALHGHPVLIEFFATWSKPSEITAKAVAAAARRWGPKGVQVLSVSLDTKDTVNGIPAWIASHAIAHPVIGEGLGWDSEVAAAWHVEAIPQLFLVDAQGQVVGADLSGATPDEVGAAVDRALAGDPSGDAAAPGPAAQPAAKPSSDTIP